MIYLAVFSFNADVFPTVACLRSALAGNCTNRSNLKLILFRDLSPNVVKIYSKQEFKTFFNVNCVLLRANDLKAISNWLVVFR